MRIRVFGPVLLDEIRPNFKSCTKSECAGSRNGTEKLDDAPEFRVFIALTSTNCHETRIFIIHR